jgi:hypothetical protein
MPHAMTLDELTALLPRPNRPRAADLRPGVRYVDESNSRFVSPTFSIDRAIVSGTTSAVLISAPAAVGKSTIAKQVAHNSEAILWDLARFQVGTDTFSGTLLSTFGDRTPTVLAALAQGSFLLILDALDEAHVRAGTQNFEAFLEDVSGRLRSPRARPVVVMFARSETAELIALSLDLHEVPFAFLTVDFFDEAQASSFLEKRVQPTSPRFSEARDGFFALVYQLLDAPSQQAWSQPRVRSFLGYAPVLEATADYLNVPNYQALINELKEIAARTGLGPTGMQWRFLGEIISALLVRERGKVVSAIRGGLEPEALRHRWTDWDSLFQADEQCARVLARVLKTPLRIPMKDMPQPLVARYEQALEPNLGEHVFLGEHQGFANVVFAEYVYAWALTHGVRPLRLSLRPQLIEHRPSPILGRFVVALARGSDGSVDLDGEDVGLIYESFLSQVTRRINVTMTMFGNGNEMDCIISSDERDSDEVLFRVGISDKGVHLRRRLANGEVRIDADIRLGIPGAAFLLGPDVDLVCGTLRIASATIDVDVERNVALSALAFGTESYDLRLRTFNDAKGRLRVLWPDVAYPWVQYRDEALGTTGTAFDSERAEVLYKFILMFRRQRSRRIDTVRNARWSSRQLALRDELLDRAVAAQVLREEAPFYVFNSDSDSLKTLFTPEPRASDAAQRFAEDFVEEEGT